MRRLVVNHSAFLDQGGQVRHAGVVGEIHGQPEHCSAVGCQIGALVPNGIEDRLVGHTAKIDEGGAGAVINLMEALKKSLHQTRGAPMIELW